MSQVPIPEPTLVFAKHVAGIVTPPYRTAGFADDGLRGRGDFLDAIGTMIVFEQIARAGKKVSADITAGYGDDCDLTIEINRRFSMWNIKASEYAPFRPNLHLFVKEEEADKSVDGYIQVFVHVAEDGQLPHAHIAGVCSRHRLLTYPVVEIPNTGGHMGYAVPLRDLKPFDGLVNAAAPSAFYREAAA
jgi:hypothetical protein